MSEKHIAQPLLTVAVPTYNGARTIRNMLDILLPQVDERVEVLISDNCSTDEAPQIIAEYMEKYPFIKYMRNDKNLGADGNFLKCMKVSSGKYIYLISDDDVLTEGSLSDILTFLESTPDMGLIYLGTAIFYISFPGREQCKIVSEISDKSFFTSDKKEFFKYAKHFWGFVSSFILLRSRFKEIVNPEQYFGTYWLQSYIHILCSSGSDTLLGVVGGICVGAGVYITQSNFDTAVVDGINYKRMLDFAIENGYDPVQLKKWFVERICLLSSHGVVKEKATGEKRINKKILFMCTYMYPKAWIIIYPMMLLPAQICKLYLQKYRSLRGGSNQPLLNRPGDSPTNQSSDC